MCVFFMAVLLAGPVTYAITHLGLDMAFLTTQIPLFMTVLTGVVDGAVYLICTRDLAD